MKRSISFDEEILREAESAAAESAGGNLSAFVSDAVAQHVKLRRGRRLMRDDERDLGPVSEDALAAVDAEWPA